MMNAHLIRKGSSPPTFHSCGNDRDMIDPATFDGCVSTDRVEALSPEQLAAAPDIFNVGKTVAVLPRSFPEGRSADADFGVFGKFVQEVLKVVRFNRHVRIEIADHIRVQFLCLGIAGIKGMNLSGEVPLRALRHAEQLNPWIVDNIFAYDVVGAVG